MPNVNFDVFIKSLLFVLKVIGQIDIAQNKLLYLPPNIILTQPPQQINHGATTIFLHLGLSNCLPHDHNYPVIGIYHYIFFRLPVGYR